MKNKKQMRFFCLLMLCALLTGFFQPAAADVKAERLLKRMENLTPIPGTHLLIAQESKNHKWGLYDTDANILIPLRYEKITYIAYSFLDVASLPEETFKPQARIPLEKLNSHALMTFGGTVLTDSIYGTFKVYSPQWAAGWVLEPGSTNDYDFTPDKNHFYRIKRCDVFYCPEEETSDSDNAENSGVSCRLIASLTRAEFTDAVAHGNYLSVQNQNKEITVYNGNAETFNTGARDAKSSVYGIKNWMIVDLATGKMVMDGCSAVSEIHTEDETLLLATRIDFQGRKLNSLITTEGEVIIPMWRSEISSVSRDYAIIKSSVTGKKGLYSRVEKRMLLPMEYDDILENPNNIDRFNCHGYICVMKDDQYYCYEVETEKLLPIVKLKLAADVTLVRQGAAFFATAYTARTTTTQLISPNGKVKTLYSTISNNSHGSGYLLIENNGSGSTVINWYGNDYLPQRYSKIILTDDDRIILKTKNSGDELYRIPE